MTIHSPKLRFTSSLPTKWSSGWNTIWPSYKLHQFLCDQMSRILLPNRKEGDDKWKQERARGSPNSQVKRKGDCRDPLKKARFQKTRRQKHGEVKVGRIKNQPLDFQRESGITAGGDSLSCEPSRPHYKDTKLVLLFLWLLCPAEGTIGSTEEWVCVVKKRQKLFRVKTKKKRKNGPEMCPLRWSSSCHQPSLTPPPSITTCWTSHKGHLKSNHVWAVLSNIVTLQVKLRKLLQTNEVS